MLLPIEAMIMEKQDSGQLARSIKVGPIDSGAAIEGVENIGLEARVQRGQESEIGRVFRVLVSRVDNSPFSASLPPLLARHHRRSVSPPAVLKSCYNTLLHLRKYMEMAIWLGHISTMVLTIKKIIIKNKNRKIKR